MKVLDSYIPLVAFLGNALGEHCEVVLHDVTKPEQSIVAIANGHLSGRRIGGSLTDFTLGLLQQAKKKPIQYVTNYQGKGSTGHAFRSSSYFIKDKDGTIVGVLCLNYDIQPYLEARHMLDTEFLKELVLDNEPTASQENTQEPAFENLYKTAEDTIHSMISKRLQTYPAEAKRLSVEERMKITQELDEDGLFLLKGGISALAAMLDVSEPTIYRYLSRIRKE